MTHDRDDADIRFDTSDAACLKRGWRMADVLLAGLLALLGLVGVACPRDMPLSRRVRLDAFRRIRILEALVRRLVLAMATTRALPSRPAQTITGARPVIIPAGARVTGRVTILLDPARLGLANHYRALPAAPEPSPAPQVTFMSRRAPIPPGMRLVEAWPDLALQTISDRPFETVRRVGLHNGPRIRSFDAPLPPPAPVTTPPGAPGARGLLRRIAALRAALGDPSRLVRRMRNWLARRGDRRQVNWRPSPLGVGAPRLAMSPDERDAMIGAQAVAGRWLLRRDSS